MMNHISIKILLLACFLIVNYNCENNPSLCGVIDNCGICDNDPTNDCIQDCYGQWGGSAINDCSGTCEGTAKYDCDNNCILQNEEGLYDGNFPSEGECDCDGNLPDECGICGGAGALYICGCSGLPQLASGGHAAENNFRILGQHNYIRGISFNNEDNSEDGFEENSFGIINAGSGLLTHLEINGNVQYLENIIIERPTVSSNTVIFNYYTLDYCADDVEPTANDLPSNTLYVTNNDDVLYNSSVDIRSFEFTIIGGGSVSRACSCSGGTYDCHYIPNECINGHGITQEECENDHCVTFGVTVNCSEETPCNTEELCENFDNYEWYPAGTWDLNDECSILYFNQTNCDDDPHCIWDINEGNPETGQCILSGNEACLESSTRLDDIDNDGICDDIDECVNTSDIESSCGDTEDEHGREYCGCLGEFGAGQYRCPTLDCSGVCGGYNRQDTFDSNFDLQIIKDSIQADSLRLENCLYFYDEETCCGENSTVEGPFFCNDSTEGEIINYSTHAVDERCECNQEAQDKPEESPYGGYGCCCGQSRDCAGICNGTNDLDDCGICGGDNNFTDGLLQNGDCDCNGNIVGCDEVCGSGLIDDECNVCGGTNIFVGNQLSGPEVDCIGECFGTANYDACGICGGDSVDAYNCIDCTDLDEDTICDNVDDCIGELDECGVCNGNGILNGECDCDGNVDDECGVCGGSGMPDGTNVCLRLENNTEGVYNLVYSSTSEIAGIQFNHNGCVNSASGGEAGNAGWIMSVGSSKVLGFSFTGSVLPIGNNFVLTELNLDQNGENNIENCIFVEDCYTNIDECAFSNPGGGYLTIIYNYNP